jgi:uncharacterized protein YggE
VTTAPKPFHPLLVAFAIVYAAIICAAPVRAQEDDTPSLEDIPHITIVGTAETEVAPDLATITLGVTTERPTAKEAAGETAAKAGAVIAAAKAQGVGAPDIVTQSVTLTQTFDDIRDPQGQITGQRPRGFVAENVVAIRIRDLARAGALAELLIEKGANRFDGISFSVEHPAPILVRLTGEAVKNAQAQAAIAAEAAGMRLGRVLTMERPGADADLPAPMRVARGMLAKARAPMPVEAGTTAFSTQMAVTWALDGR